MERRDFLESLLATDSPSGHEAPAQRVWVAYVEQFADEVRTDVYGNAVAVLERGSPELAVAGHADEIGFAVREITDDGMVRLARIGGSDKTVSRGQHVTVHTDDGPVAGVVAQTAIHLRDDDGESVPDVTEQFVDVGAADGDRAEELIDRGDPITIAQRVRDLDGPRLAARGLDNRVGIWAAAETLRRVADRGTDATVYAVSTVQEEVGLRGARMVGFDLDPDAAIAVDVTHATDDPGTPSKRDTGVTLGEGPVATRGSTNHPALVDAVRSVADDEDLPLQTAASPSGTRTDADAFFTARGGIPSLYVGVPNRYMHTPVEVVDADDLEATVDLLAAVAARAPEFEPFAVEL